MALLEQTKPVVPTSYSTQVYYTNLIGIGIGIGNTI